jgi:hypothetical protein
MAILRSSHKLALVTLRALPALFPGLVSLIALRAAAPPQADAPSQSTIQFVFTADAHYGITRARFRDRAPADAHVVNAALVDRINQVPDATFPSDGGIKAGKRVGTINFVVEGGDIANRQESGNGNVIQAAGASWRQFRADYLEGLTLVDRAYRKSALYVVPGNHEASNAVGFYKPMTPLIDKSAMAEIYNLMMRPKIPRTPDSFNYLHDKVLRSMDTGGIHFAFVTIWPDSTARRWLETDLGAVARATPVVIFAHDQPDAEANHFRNPNGLHDINAQDRFENLLTDQFADGSTIDDPSVIEQRALEVFIHAHPNVAAYFHGNSNWNEFYDWVGPDRSIVLHTFRVDSPMKGAISSGDETKLSFQVATIDLQLRQMTVRECLWNANPAQPGAPLAWGTVRTVSLAPLPPTH